MEQKDNDQLKAIQACLLGILKAIDKVCREHNLEYFLSDGTMLGAVRHQGFIPWDDDADIFVPRPSYDALLEHFDEWMPKEYGLITGAIDPHYPYIFARIYDKRTTYVPSRLTDCYTGIPVDIFPLDGIIEAGKERDLHLKKFRRLQKKLYFYSIDPYSKKGFSRIGHIILRKLINGRKVHEKLDALMKKYDYEKSPYICNYFCNFRKKDSKFIYPRSFFGKPVDVPFEDATLLGIPDPHDYLTASYGDYIQIPPVEKRPKPNFRGVNLTLPIDEYLKQIKETKR